MTKGSTPLNIVSIGMSGAIPFTMNMVIPTGGLYHSHLDDEDDDHTEPYGVEAELDHDRKEDGKGEQDHGKFIEKGAEQDVHHQE